MSQESQKDALLHYLRRGREALLWKVEGVGEYDLRRPLTPTGTNLLGLLKHTAGVEAGYLGDVFGRPFPQELPWTADDAEDNADMWATPDETRAGLVDLYHRVQEHSEATVAALDLDAVGVVPWWGPDGAEVDLHTVLVHVIAETHRHAGHADLVRELVDGSVGMREGAENLPPGGRQWWEDYHARVEAAARESAAMVDPT